MNNRDLANIFGSADCWASLDEANRLILKGEDLHIGVQRFTWARPVCLVTIQNNSRGSPGKLMAEHLPNPALPDPDLINI